MRIYMTRKEWTDLTNDPNPQGGIESHTPDGTYGPRFVLANGEKYQTIIPVWVVADDDCRLNPDACRSRGHRQTCAHFPADPQ